jgi:GNAT superfamily N-acetyltransferase
LTSDSRSVAPGATRWRPRAALGRVVELARSEGLRVALIKALGETVYRRLDVVELRLPVTVDVEPEPELERRFLHADDQRAYEELHADAPEELGRRLAQGHRCFGVWLDGRLVATRWFATERAPIEYLGREVPLQAGELYLYELYTAPAARGQSLTRAAGAGAVAALSSEGASRLVGVVLPENRSVRRAYEKGGWSIVGRIGFVRLGRWRRDFGSLSG